jgi:hypothetical protein
MLERALKEIRALQGDDDPNYTSGARISMAAALLAEGDLRGALPLAEQGMAPSRTYYPGSQVLANEMRLVALITLHLGRYAEASQLMDEAVKIEQSLKLQPWAHNRFRLAQARLAVARQDAAEALAQLDRIVAPAYVSVLPLDLEAAERDLLRARAHLQRADFKEAQVVAARVRNAVRRSTVADRFQSLEAEAATVEGQARLALNDASAVEPLEAAVALLAGGHVASSPWLAEARLALSQAYARGSAPEKSVAFRREAERALAASGAGPHFRLSAARAGARSL